MASNYLWTVYFLRCCCISLYVVFNPCPALILSAVLLWKNRAVLSSRWNLALHGGQKPSCESSLKEREKERERERVHYCCDTQGIIMYTQSYHVLCCFVQIADQVGELLIHCRYGCKMRHDNRGEFEVDPSGTCTLCNRPCLFTLPPSPPPSPCFPRLSNDHQAWVQR